MRCALRRFVPGLVVGVALGACQARVENPFRPVEGTVRLLVMNTTGTPVTPVVLGGPEPITLLTLMGRATQAYEVPWIGRRDFRVRLDPVGGGQATESFTIEVAPGDRLVLEIRGVFLRPTLRRQD